MEVYVAYSSYTYTNYASQCEDSRASIDGYLLLNRLLKIPPKKRPKERVVIRSHVLDLGLGPIRQNPNFMQKVYE